MSDSLQERKEECRREVLRYLANRSVLAYRAETIKNALWKEFGFELVEINAALTFLEGLKYIAAEPAAMGATKYFRVTSEGVLFNERTA